jgi:uncharacterized protein (TIGR03545 family)
MMKKGLFKKGLIAVVGVFILIGLIWFVVVDWVVEMVIESQGTKAVGARVDVAEADLSLFPAGIEVRGLQVTNPDSPMSNALDVRRIYSDIELMPLIKRKVIIDNLRMEGIRLNTPRKTSGAVAGGKSVAQQETASQPPWLDKMCAGQSAAPFSIPEVQDILSHEKLQSLALAQQISTRIDTAKAQWQQRLKDLPTREELEAYKTRLDKIKAKGGGLASLLGSATELKSLTDDLRKDLGRLEKAKADYQSALQELKNQSAQLTRAPLEDVQRLKSKYAVSSEGLANLSRTLFGPSVCRWWERGYQWYARIKPYIGAQGASTQKESEKPGKPAKPALKKGDLPDFLVRSLHVDALLEAGSFTGEATDITSDPGILGKPLAFKFLGRRMQQIQSINMDGVLNFIQPGNPRQHVKLLVEKCGLNQLQLGTFDKLPVAITKALADISMNIDMAGPTLDALAKARLEDVQMAVEKSAGSELTGALADAVTSVTHFALTAIVKGNDPDYTARIQSDLDPVLRKAMGQIISKATSKFEAQLKAAIDEKTQEPIKNAHNQLGGLENLTGEFARRLDFGNSLLQNIKLPF